MSRIHILVFFLFITFSTVNTRSIQHDSDVELLVTNRINANKHLSATIASYRHRFEHSPNFKALRWALSEQFTPPYCDFCHLFVPTVSLIYSYVVILHCSHLRFGFSLILIKQSMLKISRLLYVKILNYFSISMFVLEPHMSIGWVIFIPLIKNRDIFFCVHIGRCDWNINHISTDW